MKKYILRYTIGRVSNLGWTILFESIRQIKKVYPEFSIYICHNKLYQKEIEKLKNLEVSLIKQDDLAKSFSFVDSDENKIRNFCWKLIPARICQESHELWIDNDIVIRDRISKLDYWLSQKTSIISTGFYRDYGMFSNLITAEQAYCAGFFGLPPNFDFEKEINYYCKDKILKGFDEQGLTTLIATSIKDYIVLSQQDITLFSEHWRFKTSDYAPSGFHFARANRFDWHKSWKSYKTLVNV